MKNFSKLPFVRKQELLTPQMRFLRQGSSLNYIFLVESILVESGFAIVESAGAILEESVAGAIVLLSAAVESVVVAVLEPEPHAANTPRAITNKIFFIFVNVLL